MRSVFVTGGSGFLGRSLLGLLEPKDYRVSALWRGSGTRPRCARTVDGDLASADLDGSLGGVDVVVHLAAVSGKASPRRFAEVNVVGTQRLVTSARRQGVSKVVLVSSVAAGFADLRRYPYGRSKREAEDVVRSAGLDFAILRPTLLLGRGAPGAQALKRLVMGARPWVFGDGQNHVQPLHVEDAARAVVRLVDDPEFLSETIPLGGPERLTTADLLVRLARAGGFPGGSPRRLPGRFLAAMLHVIEKPCRRALPFTAGQLQTFLQDGVAEAHPLAERLVPLRGVDAMLEECWHES